MSAEDRRHVAAWVLAERAVHADTKWQASPNRGIALTQMREDPAGHWYLDYVRQYMHRASLVGLNTATGRQLLGKAVVTALHALETAVEVYGPMPEPGHPSGEVRPWIRAPKPEHPPQVEEREWWGNK